MIILSFIPTIIFSQNYEISLQELIEKLTEYRSKIISENKSSINNLRLLEHKWGEFDIHTEEFKNLALNIIISKKVYDFSAKSILRAIRKECPECKLKDKITEEDIEILGENYELLDLILEDILKPTYPYVLNANTEMYKEIEFYKINNNDKIGEIGAGNGTFSIILGMLNKELNISINELSYSFIKYIEQKVSKNNVLFQGDKISIIKGEKKTTNFEGGKYDKIIIRNSFHHFSNKDKMLESIRRSLKPNGRLYLNEPIKELDPEEKICKDLLTKEKLINEIERNGFDIEKQEQLEYGVLIEFKMK